MKQVRIPPSDIRTQYIQFRGGIDLATPMLSITPGNTLEAMNYEPGLNGGYRRIDGFERYDGRPAPSSATYLFLEGTAVAPIQLGATVTGATSGATGVAVMADQANGALCVTKTAGEFQAGEQLLVGGAIVGTLTDIPALRGYRDAKNDALALAAAADAYRADIGPVPGSGPVRGVWMFLDVLYAWRDLADGTACALYKATAAGWTQIQLGEEIAFTNANASVQEGAVLTQGATPATALITRVVLETGSLASGVNTGRLILANRTAALAAGAATTTGKGAGTLTLGGASTPITMLPGGRFEFVNGNMGGTTATFRMYGCDGKNRAFEFDGTVFVPIKTGAANDTPAFLVVHKQRLFLALEASIQWSGDGNPYRWTVTDGAGTNGMGDNVTGFAVQAGDALGVFARNLSSQLQGATNNSFQMLPISTEVGALPYSVQTVGKTVGMDDRGLVATDRTQAFGNFVQATISTKVQPLVDALRQKVVGSMVYRSRGQYRVYGADGSGLIASFGENGNLLGITQLQYPVNPTCFASCEDATGRDAVFFGADNGYVYRADIGSSFDGAEIEAFLRMPFNNMGGPRIRKRFRKAVLEMAATAYTSIRFQPEFSYGDPDVGTHRLQTGEVTGGGGYWDVSTWDTFFYDAQLVNSPAFSIEGTGLNMALLFYTSSAVDLGHVLQGMLIHFTPKRLER
jgi:hypothetical protein